ncbi:MAG TPA: PD-(D/E)XK nuclease family protein [Bacillota bacterium]|nr:PD-(D/E)XK nuclease family protein [Bacillota bacterium]
MKYVKKIPEAASDALAFGGLIHKIIAAYNQHCLNHGLETDITAMAGIARQCFYAEPCGLSSDRFPEVLALAEQIAASHTVNPLTVVGIEEWVQAWLADRKYLFRGIIDRLDIQDNLAIITDYKTDWQLRTQADVEADFQLAVYAWLVAREYPQVDTFTVRLDFVRHGVVRETTLDAGRVAQAEGQILGLIGQVEQALAKGKFPPRPGHFCAWCGYSSQCPAAKSIPADVRPIMTADDARAVAEELAILERQIAVRKEALKNWCNQAGPVEVNGITWGFHLVESRTIEDVPEFVRLMNEAGQDPRPFLAVNGTKAKKIYNNPELMGKLQSVIKDRSYTRFDSKKVAGGEVA